MSRCLLYLTGEQKGVNQVSLYFIVRIFLTIKSLCDFMVLLACSVWQSEKARHCFAD